MICIK